MARPMRPPLPHHLGLFPFLYTAVVLEACATSLPIGTTSAFASLVDVGRSSFRPRTTSRQASLSLSTAASASASAALLLQSYRRFPSSSSFFIRASARSVEGSAAAGEKGNGDDENVAAVPPRRGTGHQPRRDVLFALASVPSAASASAATSTAFLSPAMILFSPIPAAADDNVAAAPPVQVTPGPDAKPLFNEARALESQGRVEAALRLYAKVTKISPRFVYGWSNLGNAQVALGQLGPADESYTTAIDLCREGNSDTGVGGGFGGGGRRCNDLYLILLNRGCLRLNDGRPKEALRDLDEADSLRGRPDAVILQNRARARELNGLYDASDRDYAVAISMTSNEVAPFWLRAALVKYQLGDLTEAYNILRRVEARFPEAPEVRAASAAMLATTKGDMDAARRKLLEIPDRQRLKFASEEYLTKVVAWPPAMKESLARVSRAVGDAP